MFEEKIKQAIREMCEDNEIIMFLERKKKKGFTGPWGKSGGGFHAMMPDPYGGPGMTHPSKVPDYLGGSQKTGKGTGRGAPAWAEKKKAAIKAKFVGTLKGVSGKGKRHGKVKLKPLRSVGRSTVGKKSLRSRGGIRVGASGRWVTMRGRKLFIPVGGKVKFKKGGGGMFSVSKG